MTALGVWLTGETVHAMGNRYDGEIANVTEQMVRNRFTTKQDPVLVGGCRRVERADSKTGQPIVSWQKFLQRDAGFAGTVG